MPLISHDSSRAAIAECTHTPAVIVVAMGPAISIGESILQRRVQAEIDVECIRCRPPARVHVRVGVEGALYRSVTFVEDVSV